MKFTFCSGQRPLEGYTLKRGIGRGGFGEVYFALSDGGKEVALKLLRDDQHLELRGVAQCLNLKHHNLVGLYDLKRDLQGEHWVVMEYVAGEPLSVVLTRHPGGVPRELAREWFLGLARAITYLHDHGIVHRDLKPGNVFLENGVVKVGDYGLSKSISTSQRTAHTQSVGTVHYMAPEISTGNYNKQIDIYAAGIILYEMLSGRVPFEGESSGEILMKHLTSPPDLSKLPAEYIPIVAKALAKNPAQRYASMAEMARAVESVGHDGKGIPVAQEVTPPVAPARPQEPILTALPALTWRGLTVELCSALLMAVLFTGLGTILWAAVTSKNSWADLSTTFFLTVATTWAILVPSKIFGQRRGDSLRRRVILLLMGGLVGLGAWWLDGWSPDMPTIQPAPDSSILSMLPNRGVTVAGYFSYYALAFFALRWWRMTERRRAHRFSFAPILAAGFWGLILMQLVRPVHGPGLLVLMMSAAIVQLVSPWEQPPPPPAKRMRLRYA
jgi:hypothetical protein